MLKDHQDAFGHGMYDYLNGREGSEIAERDDGYIAPTGGPAAYFLPHKRWPPVERRALRFARGRLLDVGCGAGRHALHLQAKGLDVVGIDSSPLAVEVCRRRGLRDARLVPITQIDSSLGTFDTVLLFGNNFGLFGNPQRARRRLRRIERVTSARGRILAVSNDTYRTDDPDHLAYHASNRAKGRLSGQLRFRVRYRRYATPWFDWLIVSREEMQDILDGTGWAINRFLDSDSSYYIAIIDK